jgi:hypothetical protein
MGVSVSFKFDAESMARFNRGLEEFARESGWSMEYTALYTAAFLCRDTMWYTPPFVDGSWQGTTKAAELAGRGALMRDINKIFRPIDARGNRTVPGLVLSRLATSARLGRMSDYFDAQEDAKAITFDSEVVNKIVRDPNPTRGYYKAKNYFAQYSVPDVGKMGAALEAGELRPIHQSLLRKHKGSLKMYKPTTRSGYYLVKSKGILNAYIKERMARIGNLKSGWWKVMQTLPKPKKKGRSGSIGGVREIASFIKRHGGVAGYQTTNFSKENFSVIIGNLIGDADGVATRTQAAERAIMHNDVRLKDAMEQEIRKDISRFNQG